MNEPRNHNRTREATIFIARVSQTLEEQIKAEGWMSAVRSTALQFNVSEITIKRLFKACGLAPVKPKEVDVSKMLADLDARVMKLEQRYTTPPLALFNGTHP